MKLTLSNFLHTVWSTLAAGAMICAAACGGRSVSGVNGNGNDFPDGGPDSDAHRVDAIVFPDGRPPDGLPPDAWQPCEHDDAWWLEAVSLSEIQILNPMGGGDGIPEGVAVRIKAVVEVTGCDRMAGVRPHVDFDDKTVNLTGFVWRYNGDRACPSLLEYVPEYLSLPGLSPGDWDVYDFMINGPSTPFYVRPCLDGEDCHCYLWDGIPGEWGAQCSFDCMCKNRLDCNYEGDLTDAGFCYQTCSVDMDCPPVLFCHRDMLTDTPNGICMATGLIQECVEGQCAPGFECQYNPDVGASICTAVMDADHIDTPCATDCDCPAGFACAEVSDIGMKTCQIMCRGNRDCPAGLFCDAPELPNLSYCQMVFQPHE
jgi:hypothetical protein